MNNKTATYLVEQATINNFIFDIVSPDSLNADSINFIVDGIGFDDFMDKLKK